MPENRLERTRESYGLVKPVFTDIQKEWIRKEIQKVLEAHIYDYVHVVNEDAD